jgi:hypothetical protein
MLKISDRQILSFRKTRITPVLGKLIVAVRNTAPPGVAGWSEDLLAARVHFACLRGLDLGAATDVALEPYVILMMEFGPHFDLHPAIKPILEDRTTAFEDRIDLLFDQLPQHVWAELEILSGEAAWDAVEETTDA